MKIKEVFKMKICWDNLEKITYSVKTKKFYGFNGSITYEYKESCGCCGEPFLYSKYDKKLHKFCSTSCSKKGKNHPLYNKKASKETKKKMGKAHKGLHKGKKSLNGKFSYYDTYAKRLYADKTRRDPLEPQILQVKCTWCGQWYRPNDGSVRHRVNICEGKEPRGEARFYCSDNCKQACPIYGKRPDVLMKEDAIRAGNYEGYNREVQPELRQLVFQRDDYTCQKCEERGGILNCHHITGVKINPIESADVDNCITLCKQCHKEVHTLPGCTYNELKNKCK
jgi:5-methylcytosine-specific restriction endonuclease McrA